MIMPDHAALLSI